MLFGSTEIELLHPTGEPTEAAKHRFDATHEPKEATAPKTPHIRADVSLLRAAMWAQIGRFGRIA